MRNINIDIDVVVDEFNNTFNGSAFIKLTDAVIKEEKIIYTANLFTINSKDQCVLFSNSFKFTKSELQDIIDGENPHTQESNFLGFVHVEKIYASFELKRVINENKFKIEIARDKLENSKLKSDFKIDNLNNVIDISVVYKTKTYRYITDFENLFEKIDEIINR